MRGIRLEVMSYLQIGMWVVGIWGAVVIAGVVVLVVMRHDDKRGPPTSQ